MEWLSRVSNRLRRLGRRIALPAYLLALLATAYRQLELLLGPFEHWDYLRTVAHEHPRAVAMLSQNLPTWLCVASFLWLVFVLVRPEPGIKPETTTEPPSPPTTVRLRDISATIPHLAPTQQALLRRIARDGAVTESWSVQVQELVDNRIIEDVYRPTLTRPFSLVFRLTAEVEASAKAYFARNQ